MKRLLKDLKEIHEHPLENIAAAPLEKNAFIWHANIRGVDDSMKETFHFILQFPQSYPNDPPSVTLCTPIPHPNVFPSKNGAGYSLCMDMLEDGEWATDLDKNVKYSGWSSAYSVQIILVQLQAFLLDAQLQYATHKASLVDSLNAAKKFACKDCPHSPTACHPPLPTPQQLADRTVLRVTRFVPGVRPAHMDHPKLPMRRVPTTPASATTTSTTSSTVNATQKPSPSSTQSSSAPSASASPAKSTLPATPAPPVTPRAAWVLVTPKRQPIASSKKSKPNKSTNPTIFSSSYLQPMIQSVQNYKAARPATTPSPNGNHITNGKQSPRIQTPKAKQQQPAQNQTSSNGKHPAKPQAPKDLVVIMLRDADERKRMLEERAERERQEEKLEKARLRKQNKKAAKKKQTSKPATNGSALSQNGQPAQNGSVHHPNGAAQAPKRKEAGPQEAKTTQQATTLTAVPDKLSWADDGWSDAVSVKYPSLPTKPKKHKPLPTSTVAYKEVNAPRINPAGLGNLSALPVDTLLQIFAHLSSQELAGLSLVSKDINKVAADGLLWKQLFCRHYPNSKLSAQNIADWKFVFMREVNNILDELACFHTKLSFEEDVLGIPINFTVNPRTEKVDYISSSLDILSSTAFVKHKIRKSPFKEPFTHFLPLYITEDHFQRALPEIKKVIVQLSPEYRTNSFTPSMVLSVFGKLMNTMVVLVMDGGIAASAKALNGYMAFHRLMLAFIEIYPQLMLEVNQSIEEFIRAESGRVKSAIPSLGDWLACVSVSNKYTWKNVAKCVISESFDRNVLWICKEDPSLATLKDINSNNNNAKPGVEPERLTKSFEHSKVSQMLMLFHSYFLTFIAHPQGMSLAQVADNYDRYFGRPSYKTQDSFQRAVKKIQGIRGWPDFYLLAGLPCPSQKDMTQLLRESVRNSKKKGYHSDTTNFRAVQASGTSVILKKNDKFSAPSNLENVIMGLGWGYETEQVMFLDASCFEYTKDGQCLDVVNFTRTQNKNKCIVHSGDKVNHEKRSVEHTISLTLSKIRPDTEFLVFTITSYNGTLAAAKMPWVRMSDAATSNELCQYILDKTGNNTAAIMCIMQRNLTKRCWDLRVVGKLDEGSAPAYTPLKANIGTLLTGMKVIAPTLNATLESSFQNLPVSSTSVALSLKLTLPTASKSEASSSATGRWVIVVLDNSGSMGGSAISQAKESITELVETLLTRDPSVKVSIIVFDHNAHTLYSRGSDLAAIKKTVNAIKAQGGTDFVAAFNGVSDEVSNCHLKTDNAFVVFFTDGGDGSSIEARRTAMKTLASNLEINTAGASLHTIGFTSGHDARLLGEITAIGTTQGTSQYVADSTKIKPAIASLVSSLSAKNAVVGKLTVASKAQEPYFEKRVFFSPAGPSFVANVFIPAGLFTINNQVVLTASSGEATKEFELNHLVDREDPSQETAVYLSVAFVKDSLVQLSQKLFGQTTPSNQELQLSQTQVAEFENQMQKLTKQVSSTLAKSHKQLKELALCIAEFQKAIVNTKAHHTSNEEIAKLNSLLYKAI